jgi:cytochrome c-type biogenesis protein CcmH/NrfF
VTLPLAHLGHYLWILYLLPVIIVIGGILRVVLVERRSRRKD